MTLNSTPGHETKRAPDNSGRQTNPHPRAGNTGQDAVAYCKVSGTQFSFSAVIASLALNLIAIYDQDPETAKAIGYRLHSDILAVLPPKDE